MTPSFKFSTRHLLVVIAAAAFVFWFVKNYYDSQKIAEMQSQLRAAKTAGSIYLYDKLLSDKNVFGKKIAEYPGLEDLSFKLPGMDDRELAERAIEDGEQFARGKQHSQPKPTVTYVSGDRVLVYYMNNGPLLPEGSHTTGFYVYIRNGKILAIFDHVTRVPS